MFCRRAVEQLGRERDPWTTSVVQYKCLHKAPIYSSLCFFECPIPNRSFESANADAFLFFCLPFCSFLFAFLLASSSGSLIACSPAQESAKVLKRVEAREKRTWRAIAALRSFLRSATFCLILVWTAEYAVVPILV